MLDDPCFKRLRDQEFLKGREYRTQVRTSIGALVTSIDRRFGVEFYGYTDTPLSGGWRAFPYEAETVESAFEGSNTPVRMIKNYQYEPAKQGGRQYGNVTRFEQRDQTGALYRVKDYFYAARDDPAGYLVDRRWQEAIRDGRGNLLGITQYFYDGLDTSPASLGTEGKLTRVSRYYDVPPQPSSQGITLHGIDTTYRHDAYGNVVAVTTYDEPSTRLWSGGNSFSIGPPGNGTAGSATSTTYDPTLHVYPIEVRKPLGLVTKTDYDYRIGTVKRVTDANGASTIAEYDLFGRMTKLIKSGDTLAAPTVQTFYLDWEQPFRYVFAQRERSGQAANRPTQRFYDGLGRELQTKSESKEATQNIVVDKMYDAFDRVVRESQPRYVDEAPDAGSPGSSFWRYTVPDGSVRWTTTEYDSVGRAVRVTQADGAATNHRYEVHQDAPGVWMVVDDVLDANRHRTQYAFDAFGRLVKVHELSGECGTYGGVSYPCGPGQENWGIKSQTRYSYDPRDLLTRWW